MNPVDVIDVGRDAIVLLIRIAGPVMIAGLVVGLVIALFQALTQIQEMTIAFVPKILVVFVATLVLLPFMITAMQDFSLELFDRMVAVGTQR